MVYGFFFKYAGLTDEVN